MEQDDSLEKLSFMKLEETVRKAKSKRDVVMNRGERKERSLSRYGEKKMKYEK